MYFLNHARIPSLEIIIDRKQFGQFLVNLTQLINLPMVKTQNDKLNTDLSTDFVDKPSQWKLTDAM